MRAHGVPVGRQDVVGGRAHAGELLERERAELPAVGHLVRATGAACRAAARRAARAAPTGSRRAGRTTCRPSRRARRSRAPRRRARRCGAACTASTYTRAPAACAAATIPGRSGTVPTAFDAAVTATQRVRSVSTASTADAGSSSVSGLGLGEAHRRPGALGRDQPRAHVRVVVQARADDLVARPQRAPGGGREAHRHGGHARAEGDAARVAAEQRRRRSRACSRPARRCAGRPRTARRGWRCGRSASSRPSPRSRRRPSACRPARRGAPSRRAGRGSGRGSSGDLAQQLAVAVVAEQLAAPRRPAIQRISSTSSEGTNSPSSGSIIQ